MRSALAVWQWEQFHITSTKKQGALCATKKSTMPPQTESKIVRFSEAALALNAKIRTIHTYVKNGLLTLAVIPGNKRARGITRASLEKLIQQIVGIEGGAK